MTIKVSATPTCVDVENRLISQTESGEAIKAPPPNPMIAMPVAMPGPIGEPADQRRDRRDVADAETNAAEHAVAEIDDPQAVEINADRRDDKAAGPTERRGKHRAARPALLDPAAEDSGRGAEKEDRDAEDPAELGQFPVVGRRLGDADELGHRQVEDAEGVGLADAEMDAQRRRRDQPAAIARRRDRAVPMKKRNVHALPLRFWPASASFQRLPHLTPSCIKSVRKTAKPVSSAVHRYNRHLSPGPSFSPTQRRHLLGRSMAWFSYRRGSINPKQHSRFANSLQVFAGWVGMASHLVG